MTENIERRIGPYRLGQILGHGGSSTVYEAVDDRDGYLVALKIIATPTDAAEEDTLVRRLERSSRAVAGLSHPNIARVYETGEAVVSGSPANTLNTLPSRYIAMERVEGITLRERLKREGGPLSLAQAADILEQVARGLDAIHQAGVIHRDIKPSNILLGIDGKVKLTDFEIARRPNDTAVTLDGVMIGSPHYISPEQTTNQSATFASDLWSLGVVLYEMVVGKVPFAGENIPATLYQIAHGDAPEIPMHLPPDVREVLVCALVRDPDQRFPSATALAMAFRRAVESTTRPSAERTRYSTKKRYSFAPLALAVIGGLALVGGGVLSLPRRTTENPSNTTSVATSAEKRPATPTAPKQVRSESRTAEREKKQRTPSIPTPLAPGADKPVALVSPVNTVPTPLSGTVATPAVTATAAPVTVTERTPDVPATPSPTPTVAEERRDPMPAPLPPALPPLEVSQEQPQQDLQPLPKATPKPTPVPATPTPAPVTSTTPSPAAKETDSEENEQAVEAEDPNTRLTGTWRGTYSGHSARLVLREPNKDTGEFRGTLIVQLPSGPTRIAVVGQAFDDGGITIRENRVLKASADKDWDRAINTGTFDPEELTLSGQGKDKKGRNYPWSFRR
jgi:serine/threonine protein kinase